MPLKQCVTSRAPASIASSDSSYERGRVTEGDEHAAGRQQARMASSAPLRSGERDPPHDVGRLVVSRHSRSKAARIQRVSAGRTPPKPRAFFEDARRARDRRANRVVRQRAAAARGNAFERRRETVTEALTIVGQPGRHPLA